MIQDFQDFCLYVYVMVDDLYQEVADQRVRPGPAPHCSDSELITLCLIGECKGWDVETELLSHMQAHRDLFPVLPSQSRFNRRRRHLMMLMNWMRRRVLATLDVAQDRLCVIDSLPLAVVAFHRVPASTADWWEHGARFGKVSSKSLTIFGFKLHLLTTHTGVILDFVIAPANATDLAVGEGLLDAHTDRRVLGDKGYISAELAAQLEQSHRLSLQTLPRSNQAPVSAAARRVHNAIRQVIETVNAQLTEQFNIEDNHAHSFWGLCTRVISKLTAHTVCIALNRLLHNPNFLQIKALAFPAN